METLIDLKGSQGPGACEVPTWLAQPGGTPFFAPRISVARKQPEAITISIHEPPGHRPEGKQFRNGPSRGIRWTAQPRYHVAGSQGNKDGSPPVPRVHIATGHRRRAAVVHTHMYACAWPRAWRKGWSAPVGKGQRRRILVFRGLHRFREDPDHPFRRFQAQLSADVFPYLLAGCLLEKNRK